MLVARVLAVLCMAAGMTHSATADEWSFTARVQEVQGLREAKARATTAEPAVGVEPTFIDRVMANYLMKAGDVARPEVAGPVVETGEATSFTTRVVKNHLVRPGARIVATARRH